MPRPVALFPVGSHGDVHPYVGLAQRLQSAGHSCTIFTNELYRELVESRGLKFRPVGTVAEAEALTSRPDIWHPRRAVPTLLREGVIPLIERQFLAVRDHCSDRETLLISSALGFGVRLAEEKWGHPHWTLHLQPLVLWSKFDSPRLSRGSWTGPQVPVWLKQLQYRVGRWWMLDRLLLRSLNDLRKKYQLPPVDSAAELLHSRHHTAALFPEWFAPRQPDWPTPLSYWGFPRWDEADSYSARPELTEFLQQGSPPIVFTPGTAQAHAQGFWQAAVGALAHLGARGIFLTRHPHQLPPSLPGTVRHFPYVPLSRLLPECRAVVHHGGIGTVSQGLAAGIPQVVTPFAYDQPDNGTRLCRLGVARMVFASDLSHSKLARGLAELLDSPSTAAACERWRVALRDTDSLGTAVSLIENWR